MRTTRWLRCSVVLAAACGSGDSSTGPVPTVAPVATVTLSTTAATLNPSQTIQLTAIEKDSSGTVLSGRAVLWSTLAPTVATVSTTGLVTAVGIGSTTVSATSEGKSANATITVAAVEVPVATVTITAATTTTLVPTQTVQLTAVEKDSTGAVLAGRTVTWSTATPAVATVSASGLVAAVATGSASITATSEAKSASSTITVVDGTLIGAAGGTVVAAGGNVTITIPAGALSQPTGITVAAATQSTGNSLITGTGYAFGPDGTQFSAPVNVSIKYNPANLPAGTAQADLHMFTGNVDTSVMIVGGTVDSVAHVVQGPTTHFSLFYLYKATAITVDADGKTATGDLFAPITVCAGESLRIDVDPDPALPFTSVTASNPSLVSLGAFGHDQPDQLGLDADVVGTTRIGFRKFAQPGTAARTLYIDIKIVNDNPPCDPVPIAADESTATTDDIILYTAGTLRPLTSDGHSTAPVLGGPGTNGDAFADCTPQGGSCTFSFYGTGIGGPPPTVVSVTPNLIEGGTFPDPTRYLFSVHQNGGPTSGIADLWQVTPGNNTPVRITNFAAHVANPAAATTGTIFVEEYGVPQATPTHIWSFQYLPGITQLPVTTIVPLTSGAGTGEISPAVSQDNSMLAFVQIPLDFSGSRIQLMNLANPTGPLVPVSPATGYAFSPSWCGNDYLYYVWSQGTNGPYLVYRWNRLTTAVVQILAFSGASFPAISVGRTNGDGGMHSCPQ